MPDAPQRAQEAVSFAKDRNFEREAVTDERDIMRDALRRGMGDLTYSQVRDNFEHRHAIGEFQTVEPARSTTPGGSSRPARPSPRNWRQSSTCSAARTPSSRS